MSSKRIERKKWTAAEIDLLFSMVEGFRKAGIRPRWREIAAATGHHENSCTVKYHAVRGRAADLEVRRKIDEAAARPKIKPPPVHSVPIRPRVENPEFGRSTSIYRLCVEAELRDRIAIQGVTAGLLGDPLPGRSALDRRPAADTVTANLLCDLPRRSPLDQMRAGLA